MNNNLKALNDSIIVNVEHYICWITFNKPEALNTLTNEFLEAMTSITEDLKTNNKIKVVVLRADGPNFMAGGDIKEFKKILNNYPDKTQHRDAFENLIKSFHTVILNIRSIPHPVIASVQGAVAGAGISLMLACDLAIAGESAFFTLAYCHIGASPDGGSTYFLPHTVGLKRSLEIALLGNRFDALCAEKWGLINRVVTDENLHRETRDLATKLSKGPSFAYRQAKKLMNQESQISLETQLNRESTAFANCSLTQDFNEGVTAFINKRKPNFIGK